jgi:hypothetical protein
VSQCQVIQVKRFANRQEKQDG